MSIQLYNQFEGLFQPFEILNSTNLGREKRLTRKNYARKLQHFSHGNFHQKGGFNLSKLLVKRSCLPFFTTWTFFWRQEREKSFLLLCLPLRSKWANGPVMFQVVLRVCQTLFPFKREVGAFEKRTLKWWCDSQLLRREPKLLQKFIFWKKTYSSKTWKLKKLHDTIPFLKNWKSCTIYWEKCKKSAELLRWGVPNIGSRSMQRGHCLLQNR